MMNIKSLIQNLDGPSKVARALRKGPSTVSEMSRRGSIPPEYWREILDLAKDQGLKDVTADYLVDIHARPSAIDESSPPG